MTSAGGLHEFCWRDAMDVVVRWRQLSEPNDQVSTDTSTIKCHAEECNNQDVHHQSPATKSAGFMGMHLFLRWRTIALLNCIAATDCGVVQVLQALPAVTLGGDPLSGQIPKI